MTSPGSTEHQVAGITRLFRGHFKRRQIDAVVISRRQLVESSTPTAAVPLEPGATARWRFCARWRASCRSGPCWSPAVDDRDDSTATRSRTCPRRCGGTSCRAGSRWESSRPSWESAARSWRCWGEVSRLRFTRFSFLGFCRRLHPAWTSTWDLLPCSSSAVVMGVFRRWWRCWRAAWSPRRRWPCRRSWIAPRRAYASSEREPIHRLHRTANQLFTRSQISYHFPL